MNNKVFISGKIAGDDNYRSKFKSAEEEIWKPSFGVNHTPAEYVVKHHKLMMYKPVNPCELGLEGLPYWSQITVCIWNLMRCSTVYFLEDWKESRGAKIEHRWAKFLRKRIIYQ